MIAIDILVFVARLRDHTVSESPLWGTIIFLEMTKEVFDRRESADFSESTMLHLRDRTEEDDPCRPEQDTTQATHSDFVYNSENSRDISQPPRPEEDGGYPK